MRGDNNYILLLDRSFNWLYMAHKIIVDLYYICNNIHFDIVLCEINEQVPVSYKIF